MTSRPGLSNEFSCKPPRSRLQRAFLLAAAVPGCILLLFLAPPVLGIAFASFHGEVQLTPAKLKLIFSSPRILGLLYKTVCIAGLTASISVIAAWAVDWLLRKVNGSVAVFWLAIFVSGFLLSPYIFTQGWIGLLGTEGFVWKLLGWSKAPLSIYSTSGVVFILVLSHLPLGAVFVYLSRRLFPLRVFEVARLFHLPASSRLRLVELPAVGPGLPAGFLWVFVFSFWAYDIPSMLRQNLFSLEVLAAFGSFYDYGRALLLAFPPIILIVLLGLAAALPFRRTPAGFNRLAQNSGQAFWPNLFLVVIPIVTWVIPLAGVFAQLNGISGFWETVSTARRDIANSVIYGIITALIVVVWCSCFGFFLRGATPEQKFRRYFILPLPWIALPGVIIGMGYVYLFNTRYGSLLTSTNLQLVLVEVSIVAPIVMLMILVQLARWSEHWRTMGALFQIGPWEQCTRIAWPTFRVGLGIAFTVAFALAIREVPASLLNYPPGGGTIAISIETMLHFDRPEKVAALCIAQTGLLLVVSLGVMLLLKLARHGRNYV